MDAMAAQLTATQTEAAAGKAAALEHIEKHLDAAEQKIGERCDLQAAYRVSSALLKSGSIMRVSARPHHRQPANAVLLDKALSPLMRLMDRPDAISQR